MKRLFLAVAALLSVAQVLPAQSAGPAPQPTPAPAASAPAPKHRAPRPPRTEEPGGGPDKVWVNLTSSTYHCYGSRYYGKTSHGRYMTEPAAKAAGAKGSGGKTCSAK